MGKARWKMVSHQPNWRPAQLRINQQGDTAPGFQCVHQLENGRGQCPGNVFELNQATGGDHFCMVMETS